MKTAGGSGALGQRGWQGFVRQTSQIANTPLSQKKKMNFQIFLDFPVIVV
jgi:hypothetical protein